MENQNEIYRQYQRKIKIKKVCTEYGNKYIVGKNKNVVYDTVEDGKYMSALQVERLNNRELCTELEQVDVNKGKVLDTELQYCMN